MHHFDLGLITLIKPNHELIDKLLLLNERHRRYLLLALVIVLLLLFLLLLLCLLLFLTSTILLNWLLEDEVELDTVILTEVPGHWNLNN